MVSFRSASFFITLFHQFVPHFLYVTVVRAILVETKYIFQLWIIIIWRILWATSLSWVECIVSPLLSTEQFLAIWRARNKNSVMAHICARARTHTHTHTHTHIYIYICIYKAKLDTAHFCAQCLPLQSSEVKMKVCFISTHIHTRGRNIYSWLYLFFPYRIAFRKHWLTNQSRDKPADWPTD
jgi:hypothetical protein